MSLSTAPFFLSPPPPPRTRHSIRSPLLSVGSPRHRGDTVTGSPANTGYSPGKHGQRQRLRESPPAPLQCCRGHICGQLILTRAHIAPRGGSPVSPRGKIGQVGRWSAAANQRGSMFLQQSNLKGGKQLLPCAFYTTVAKW